MATLPVSRKDVSCAERLEGLFHVRRAVAVKGKRPDLQLKPG
jgi:hypothetical protein